MMLDSKRLLQLLQLLLVAAVGCGASEDAASGDAVAAAGSAGGAAVAGRPTMAAGSSLAGERASAAAGSGSVTGVSGSIAAGSGGASGVSASAAAGGGGAGAMPGGPTLTEVFEKVYSMSCAVCHSMAPSDNSNGMLGMIRSKDQFYEALVNKPTQGAQCAGKGSYIVPGDLGKSLLIRKLSSSPPCGATMPLGGMLQPTQQKLLSDWVAAGALHN